MKRSTIASQLHGFHCALVVISLALALTAKSQSVPSETSDSVPKNKTPKTEEVAEPSGKGISDQTVTMDPFRVSTANDKGYSASQTILGSRSAKNILDLPTSLAIINPEFISDFNGTRLADVIGYGVSGVIINQVNQNDNANDTMIRGFRTNIQLRDGTQEVMNNATTIGEMYDVERIEVIKGPSAMLLGNNSYLGGGINYITKSATLHPSGALSVTVGQYNYLRGSLDSSGPLLRTEGMTVLYRLTLGYLNAPTENAASYDKNTFIGGGIDISWGKERNTRFKANVFHYHDTGFGNYNATLAWGSTPDNPIINPYDPRGTLAIFQRNITDQDTVTMDKVNMTFTHQLDDKSAVRVMMNGSYYDVPNQLTAQIRALAPNNYQAKRGVFLLMQNTRSAYIQTDYLNSLKFKQLTNEFQIGLDLALVRNQTSDYPPWFEVPGIFDLRNPDYSKDASLIPTLKRPDLYPVSPHVADNTYSENTTVSYYAQDVIKAWDDRLQLVGGMRWFSPRQYNGDLNAGTYTLNLATSIASNDWKVGLIYKPLPFVSLYLTKAVNVIPQLGFITNVLPDGTIRRTPLLNQQGYDKEFGIKVDKKFDRASFYGTFAMFDMALTNVRTFDSQNNVIIGGLTTSKGAELDFGCRLEAPHGYTDWVVTWMNDHTYTPPPGSATGITQAAAPSSWSLVGKYTLSSGPLKGLMFGGGAQHQGRRFWRSYFLKNPDIGTAFVAYDFNRHLRFQLNVDNVTDKQYLVIANTSGGPDGNFPGVGQLSAPRRFRLNATYRW